MLNQVATTSYAERYEGEDSFARFMRMTLTKLISYVGENPSWLSRSTLAALSRVVHTRYGTSPDAALIPLDRSVAASMRESGVPYRYRDPLALASGAALSETEEQVPVTVSEIMLYLPTNLVMHSGCVNLIQSVAGAAGGAGGPVYLSADGPAKGQEKALLKSFNKRLPPGAALHVMPQREMQGFLVSTPALDLCLRLQDYPMPTVKAWEALLRVAKVDEETTSFNATIIAKGDDATGEHYVRMIVLEPEVLDRTKKNADGSPTEAEGDIYDGAEITKAMHWFSENGGTLTFVHQINGGVVLGDDDACLLENFQMPNDGPLDGEDLKKDTWIQAWRIKNETVWDSILKGDIKSPSIGAAVRFSYEDADASSVDRAQRVK